MGYNDIEKQRQYQRDWVKNNRTKVNALKTKSRRRNLEYVKNIKESSPCVDCNNFFPHYIMDYDHIFDNKTFTISDLINRASSIQIIDNEILKCELVCANCHRQRTHSRNSY